MPKQYPTRASLHRSDVTAVVAPAAPSAQTPASPPSATPAPAPLVTDTPAPAPATTSPAPAGATTTATAGATPPPLLTRAERRRREQAALQSTALLQPVDTLPPVDQPEDRGAGDGHGPLPAATTATGAFPRPQWAPVRAAAPAVPAAADPGAPARGHIAHAPAGGPDAPARVSRVARRSAIDPHAGAGAAFGVPAAPPSAHGSATEQTTLLTRAERRRLAMVEELTRLPEPVLPSQLAAETEDSASRAARREGEHAGRQRRKADRQRAVQPAGLAAVAGALIVATVIVDPVAVATTPQPTEDDHLRLAEDALENRGTAASRAGEREGFPDAVQVPAAADATADRAEVVASATEVLDRAAMLIETETRTTPEQREAVLAQAAIVRELSNRLAAGEAVGTADPELVEVVNATLLSVAVASSDATETGDDDATTPADESSTDTSGESSTAAEDEAADDAADDMTDDAATAAQGDEDAVAPQADDASGAIDLTDPELIKAVLAAETVVLFSMIEEAAPVPVAVAPRPATPAEILAQQIEEGREDAARLAAYRDATSGFDNGRLPMSIMAELSWAPGHFLRPDAAAQLERLNVAFRAQFGVDIAITDSYRSFEGQVRARANRGRMAAIPGTSNHGWGVAVDLGGGINRFGSSQHRWMRENAEDFGWTLPGWARERGSKPEPWHWEFEGAPDSYGD